MKILITAPSLESSRNVSGISSIVKTIIETNSDHTYFHYLLGRPDKVNYIIYLCVLIHKLLSFPLVLRREKIDLVHQNLPFDQRGVMRESIINFWCYILKIPVVLHIHGGELLMKKSQNRVWRYLSSVLFNRSQKVIVLSELEKEALEEFHGYYGALVLPNSISVKDYVFTDRSISEIDPTFLYLGRIHEKKGIIEIFEAMESLSKANIRFKFLLCGEGPLKDDYITRCKDVLGTHFEYLGVVSGKSKIEALHKADFFLLPSYFEGLPMALLEAMASGLVPVVTEVGSMKLLIKHKKNGVFVKKADSEDLTFILKELLNDHKLVEKISQNAVFTVREGFDISIYKEKLNLIYREIEHFIKNINKDVNKI